jgi:hypothetical protein
VGGGKLLAPVVNVTAGEATNLDAGKVGGQDSSSSRVSCPAEARLLGGG